MGSPAQITNTETQNGFSHMLKSFGNGEKRKGELDEQKKKKKWQI